MSAPGVGKQAAAGDTTAAAAASLAVPTDTADTGVIHSTPPLTFTIGRHTDKSRVFTNVVFEELGQHSYPEGTNTESASYHSDPASAITKTTVVSADARVVVTTNAQQHPEPRSPGDSVYTARGSLPIEDSQPQQPPSLTKRLSSDQLADNLKIVLHDPDSKEPDVILKSLSRVQLVQLIAAASKIIADKPAGEDESEMTPVASMTSDEEGPEPPASPASLTLPGPETRPHKPRSRFPATLARSFSKMAASNRKLKMSIARLEESVKRMGGSRQAEIVVFGSVSMDLLAEVGSYPREGTTQCAESFSTTPGGKGANEAVGIAKLGVGVAFVGVIGRDDFGNTLKIRLTEAGVDIEHVRELQDDTPTGVAMIITSQSDAKKSTIPCMQANDLANEDDVLAVESCLRHEFTNTLLMQLEVNVEAVFQAAAVAKQLEKDVTVMVKASPINDSMHISHKDLWQNVDILVANEHEAPCLLQYPAEQRPLKSPGEYLAAAAELQQRFHVPTVLIFTGVALVCRHRVSDTCYDEFAVPLIAVKVVDLIGAADAACAGFASARARGATLRHAMIWAMGCGCISTMKHGAQVSLPDYVTLCAFFAEHNICVYKGPRTKEEWTLMTDEVSWPSTREEEYGSHPELAQSVMHGNSAALMSRQLSVAGMSPAQLGSCADFQQQSLLHLAALYCNLDATVALLMRDAPTDVVDSYGLTPVDRTAGLIRSRAVHRGVKPHLHDMLFCLLAASSCRAQADDWSQAKCLRLSSLLEHHAADVFPGSNVKFVEPASLCLVLLFHGSQLLRQLGLHLVQSFLSDSVNKQHRSLFVIYRNDKGQCILHGAANACDARTGPALLERIVQHLREASLSASEMVCNIGRTALHYAAAQGCVPACKYLMEALRLHMLTEDQELTSPLQLCPDDKKPELEQAASFRQVFLSYGRDNLGTNSFVQRLAQDLDNHGITSWRDTHDIDGGADWQKEISQALKQCKLLLVVLTRKWLSSQYCRAEYTLRRQARLATPVLCVVPPTETQSIAQLVAELGQSIDRHEMTKLQFFSFQPGPQTPSYQQNVQVLCGRVRQLLKQQEQAPVRQASLELSLQVQPAVEPTQPYVVVADGCRDATPFGGCLSSSLQQAGFHTCLARTHHPFAEIEQQIQCALCLQVVLVFAQSSDWHFLRRVCNLAAEYKRPILVVPYLVLNVESGLDYAVFTAKSTRTVCFTDWAPQRTGQGGFGSSEVYQDIFSRFLEEVRRLAQPSGTLVRRRSLRSSLV
eukprot:m.228118 g.228118  ORF g.228118 m.228118 type:complete len:1258 (+) comp18825_c0_seq4:139-3912(+)